MFRSISLFLIGIVLTLSAATVTIQDNFNFITLNRATVAIEDHPEENPWEFDGPVKGLKCSNGILTFNVEPGKGELRMYSKEKFKSGTFTARVRFDSMGPGVNAYMGLVQVAPTWAGNSSWLLFNSSTNGHLFMNNETERIPDADIERIRTGQLKPNQWVELKIQCDATGSELFVDGKSQGKLTTKAAIPTGGMRIFFSIYAGGKLSGSMSLDSVTVTGETDHDAPKPTAYKAPAIPVPADIQPVTLPAEAPLSISADHQKAVIENRYYRYNFSFSKGLELTGIFNKFINRNISTRPEPFFAVLNGTRRLDNSSFSVTNASVANSNGGKALVIQVSNPAEKISGTLTFNARNDSPELLFQSSFTNHDTARRSFVVACPLLGHLQIGSDPKKDEFFFPFESGMAGNLECELRHTYSFTLMLQIMSVYNAEANGGIYAYTREIDGYPLVLDLKQRNAPDTRNYVYNVADALPSMFSDAPGTSIGWRHAEYTLDAGTSVTPPDATIGVCADIWKAGLKSYADFFHANIKKQVVTPRWYRECYGFLSVHTYSGLWIFSQPQCTGIYDKNKMEYTYGKSITHLEENIMQEYCGWWGHPDKPEITDEEFAKLRLTCVNGGMMGDWDYSDFRGGLEALRKEIDLVHEKKSRMTLYTFPQACAKGTKSYELNKKYARMHQPNTYCTDYSAEDMGYYFCTMEKGFADYYANIFSKMVRETDCDGIRLDVMARAESCFNPAHAHYDGTFRGKVNTKMQAENIGIITQAIHAVSPEKVVTVEHGASDYLCQFHDGYLSENLNWFDESSAWGHFRKLNAYMTVFSRFYFPEIKTWIYGPSNRKTEGTPMSLFNAVGFACTSLDGLRALRTLEENSDVFESDAEKEPYIPTLASGVFANSFAGTPDGKHVWTILNRSGKVTDALLTVANPGDAFHFVETYNDLEVKATSGAEGKLTLACPVPSQEAAAIVRMPRLLNVRKLSPNTISINCNGDASKYSCRIIEGADTFLEPPVDRTFQNGAILIPTPKGKKLIIKLYQGKYLMDEVIL